MISRRCRGDRGIDWGDRNDISMPLWKHEMDEVFHLTTEFAVVAEVYRRVAEGHEAKTPLYSTKIGI